MVSSWLGELDRTPSTSSLAETDVEEMSPYSRVRPNDTVLLGPDSLNAFLPVAIKSIQRKRVNVDYAEAGQSVSFALKRVKKTGVRKGMVLLGQTSVPPVPVRRFEGAALVLYHNTLITERYQAMLHSGTIRQTIQVEGIVGKASVRTGDRATIRFRFIKNSEYLVSSSKSLSSKVAADVVFFCVSQKVGDRFLFREGRCKVCSPSYFSAYSIVDVSIDVHRLSASLPSCYPT